MRLGRLAVVEPSLRYFIDLMKLDSSTLPARTETAIPDAATIEFVGVSYAWSNGTAALRDFSLRTSPGDKLAIVGASGSGKSLLLDLLMRLREPTRGRILFSGIDIAGINHALYYSAFGFVGQNSHLMRVSVRDFLQQGWPDQTDNDLWRILEVVDLAAVVRGLPEALNTLIGPNGWQFPAGDRQRLTLARALIRDPEVLLLDEFTIMLDSETEADLIRRVLKASPRRTVICTTHSTTVAAFFDKQVVL
jgi:ATP-binding cassette subfamily B protein